jgi:hypothetical protein
MTNDESGWWLVAGGSLEVLIIRASGKLVRAAKWQCASFPEACSASTINDISVFGSGNHEVLGSAIPRVRSSVVPQFSGSAVQWFLALITRSTQ